MFAACFRGFLESSADTHEALNSVVTTLADSHVVIRAAVAGKLGTITLNGELEDSLIHFSHARKTKEKDVPDSHRAKTAKDYLNSFDSSEQASIAGCYSHLCELTHPAAASVFCYARCNEDGTHVVIDPNNDSHLIGEFISTYSQIMHPVMAMGVMPSILTLKTLNDFGVTSLRTVGLRNVDLSRSQAWQQIRKRLSDPRAPEMQMIGS